MSEIEKITSRDNRRLVTARKIRDGKISEQIFIEGRRLTFEALRSDISIEECFVAEGFRDQELLAAVANRTSAIAEISGSVFGSIADTDRSQGIILIAKRPRTGADTIKSRIGIGGLPITVFLKEVNNPSNLGAIVRTAEAAGVASVIISRHSADVYSAKALRAAMGASFRLPIWDNADFDEVLGWAEKGKMLTTAADAKSSEIYSDLDWSIPRLLIFGSEAHGLSDADMGKIDDRIKIHMESEVESLNIAVSVGIILFEAKRQHFEKYV